MKITKDSFWLIHTQSFYFLIFLAFFIFLVNNILWYATSDNCFDFCNKNNFRFRFRFTTFTKRVNQHFRNYEENIDLSHIQLPVLRSFTDNLNQYFVMLLGTYLYSGAFLTLCCKYSCKMHTVDLPAGFSTQSFLDFLTIFCLKGLFWSPLAFGSSCSSSKTGIDIILVPSGNAGRLCLAFSESSPTALDLDFLYSLIV